MKDAIRKLAAVGTKKEPKSVLVVTNMMRMRLRLDAIRALGYECALIDEAGGGARHFLQAGDRVNLVVLDLKSTKSVEKLIMWIKENRPGVRVVCILTNADLAGFGPHAIALGADKVLGESEIDQVPEVIRNLLSQQVH